MSETLYDGAQDTMHHCARNRESEGFPYEDALCLPCDEPFRSQRARQPVGEDSEKIATDRV